MDLDRDFKKMLKVLAPRTDNSKRTHSDLHHVSRPQSASTNDVGKQTRPFSMSSGTVHVWESMDSSARTSASASQIPTQTTRSTAARNTPHTSTGSLSVSKPAPKRAGSIASSKVAAPTLVIDSRRQGHAIPRLTKTPWEAERYKRNSARSCSGLFEFPARIFKELPKEVYDCIVAQLEQIHLQHDQACPACYLKDLHSLSVTSRAWDRAATPQMYSKAYVVGREDCSQSPKLKVKGPIKLKLLRRTIRERPFLARLVRELHLPDFQTLYQQASIEREGIVNLVASLVMACPSLERLVGFYIPFSQSFDRLAYALATRVRLKERVWLLSEPEHEYSDGEDDDDESDTYYSAAHDPTERFLGLNSGHPLLTTFVLHRTSSDFAPTLNFRAIIGTLRQFPMLQHLSISGLPAISFTNLALNTFPPRLQSLRLENLPGINDQGLQRFATSHLSTSIEKLTLINLELSGIVTITTILSQHLSKLKHFALVQHRTPDLSPRISIPDFCGPSLQFIHLEFRSQSGPAIDPFLLNPRSSMEFPFANSEPISCLATSLLATNIKEGAFPALRRVRIPHDPQGVIQALCQPRATALLPSDTSLFVRPLQKTGSNGFTFMVDAHASEPQSPNVRESSSTAPPVRRTDSAFDLPISDSDLSSSVLTTVKTRLAAQARILAARNRPSTIVRVYGPDGEVRIDTAIGGFLGDIKSNIIYELKPDKSRWPGNRDQSGPPQPEWIVGIEDLLDERTPPCEKLRERSWGNCGHLVGGRVGCNTVRVEELF